MFKSMFLFLPNIFFVFLVSDTVYAGDLKLEGFNKIKSLIGTWSGTLPDGNKIEITYEEISGGAILEKYHSQDPMWWNMSSVYHLDKDKILMTHYCSWGNHPRMQSRHANIDEDLKQIAFKFKDIAQNQPEKGYMHNLTFEFQDQDHLAHHWTWREKGKDTPLKLTLIRQN